MKHYVGDRTIDGVKVTVDGVSLDPCTGVKEFTKNGFEWSYEGPEPRQLALALLVDHLRDKEFNISQGYYYRPWDVVLAEIEKCEVVCANCHRRRTYRRIGSLRMILAAESGRRESNSYF